MTVFFTSDWHFGHARINVLAGRPFSSVEEMNETLVVNHNAVVTPEDTVYVAGDVALGLLAESFSYIEQLNGKLILAPGNHDRISPHNKAAYVERFLPAYQALFSEILPVWSEVEVEDQRFLFSHYPFVDDHTPEVRYAELRPPDNGTDLLLCGHVHEHWAEKGRQFNVGVDVRAFSPVPQDVVLAWARSFTQPMVG